MPNNNLESDSVPTPDWLLKMFEDFHDLYPLGCESPVMPPPICDFSPIPMKIFANPGYSRKLQSADLCIDLHKKGHYVAMLVPMETSTEFAKKMIQYGIERIYFETRPFPNVRGVELLILRGPHA